MCYKHGTQPMTRARNIADLLIIEVDDVSQTNYLSMAHAEWDGTHCDCCADD